MIPPFVCHPPLAHPTLSALVLVAVAVGFCVGNGYMLYELYKITKIPDDNDPN